MKKRMFVLVMAMCLMFAFCGCGVDMEDGANDKTPVGGETGSKEDGGDEGNKKPEKVTLAETVLFEKDGIKVTATGMEEGFMGTSIKVLIENNSDKSITVQAEDCSINGLMIDPMFSAEVAAGKKANDEITFMSSYLKESNITVIKDIEMKFYAIDSEKWDRIMETDSVKFSTSADPNYVQPINSDGFVAYEGDGVKIVVKKMNSEDSFWGADVFLYIENNGDKNVTVQSRDVSINGFMVDPLFSCDVLAGKKAYDTMSFLQSDLEDNGITDITEMEVSFHIFDADEWETIKDTDSVTIKFE